MKHFLPLVLLFAGIANAQISVEKTYKPHEPIIIGSLVPEGENLIVQHQWKMDKASQFRAVDEDTRLHVWAPPGEHWVELIDIVQRFKVIKVPTFDPDDPKNFDKITWEEIKVILSTDIDRYEEQFVVSGTVPTPGPSPNPDPSPDPTPGPTPGPVVGFAAEARKWLQAIPQGAYKKELALGIAENFLSIGSQGGDPARNGGWSLETFRIKTRQLNHDVLGVDNINIWADPFFRPLAFYQASIFEKRNVSVKDIKAIAEIWTETGEAIKAAAY